MTISSRFPSVCGLVLLPTLLFALPDGYEPNDTIQAPIEFYMNDEDISIERLSVHSPYNDDWFKVYPPPADFPEVRIKIYFDHGQGDLEMSVHNSTGSQVDFSSSTDDNETLTYVHNDEPFYIRIYGYAGATNPDYDLRIQSYDTLEENDSAATATDLGSFYQQHVLPLTGALPHGDVDWFRFEVPWDGPVDLGGIATATPYAAGYYDVKWTVHDSALNEFTPPDGVFPAGTYYLKLYGTETYFWFRYELFLQLNKVVVSNLSPTGGDGSLHWAIEWANAHIGVVDEPVVDLTAFPCESLVLETPLPPVVTSMTWKLPATDPFGMVAAPGTTDPLPEIIGLTWIHFDGYELVRGWVEPDEPNDTRLTATPLNIPAPHNAAAFAADKSLSPRGDRDWYSYGNQHGGSLRVRIPHRECLGSVNLQGYSSSGEYSYSWDAGDLEDHVIPLESGLEGYFSVHGLLATDDFSDTTIGFNPEYEIQLEVLDRFEPNETSLAAVSLPSIQEGESRLEGVTLAAHDTDWFSLICGRGVLEIEVAIPSPGKDVDVAFRVYRDNGMDPPILLGEDLDDSDGLRIQLDFPEEELLLVELTDLQQPSVGLGYGFFYDLVTRFESVPVNIMVTSLDGGSGEGSLHGAILQANEIPDAFDLSLTLLDLAGTLHLEQSLPVLNRHLTIYGPEADCLAIDGQNAFRIFHAPQSTLRLYDLTLRNGMADDEYGGGAILGDSVLLDGVVIESCSAQATGGAISANYLELLECVIRDCRAPSGGALRSSAVWIERSALYRNEATEGDGGAIWHDPLASDLDLFQSTFSGNQASGRGGAIWIGDPAITFIRADHITVAENRAAEGGGLFAPDIPPAGLAIENSIVAGNEADIDAQLSESIRIILESDGSYNMLSGDPHLAPLDYYGGPTPCHALWPDSIAINAADPLYPHTTMTDQRGALYHRVVNGIGDLGAFESGHDPRTYPLWSIYALRLLKTEPGARPGDDYNGDGVSNLLHYALFSDGNTPFWLQPAIDSVNATPASIEYTATVPYRVGEDLFFSYWFSTDFESDFYYDWHYHQEWQQCGTSLTPFDGNASSPTTHTGQHSLRGDGAWVYTLQCTIDNLDKVFFFRRYDLRERTP